MRTPWRWLAVTLGLLTTWDVAAPVAECADGPTSPPRAEALERAANPATPGRLAVDPAGGFTFRPADGGPPVVLEPGMVVRNESAAAPPSAGLPPFRADLGLGQRISGGLTAVDARHVVLQTVVAPGPLRLDRAGVQSLVQRTGESVILDEGFETLESARWSIVGEPSTTAESKLTGSRCLLLPAGGASITYRVPTLVAAGRLETAVHDGGAQAPGHKWFVDLTFRGPQGPATVRVVLGWSETTLAVESAGGPALAVQRLARSTGWHRLAIRFGAERCEVAVDGNELAHGRGFEGPLTEIRLATVVTGSPPEARGVAGRVDDLRLVRFAEPSGGTETDVTQDEVRLTSGDQVFGPVERASAERVEAKVDGRTAAFPWSDVSGVYFRRAGRPGAAVSGLLVRAEWRPAAGKDPADLDAVEGALTGLNDQSLKLETPYCGTLEIPRDRLASLRVLGKGYRLVVDPTAHHLGDEISTAPPLLDPPQPEGGVLERAFELAEVPEGPAWLVLDVVEVVGEGGDTPFSALVRKGELRTNVSLNGTPFDNINRFIASRNETPERIRIPLPKGALRPGRNVVRFDQVGIASDPNYLDDLGVVGIALEAASKPAAAGPKRD